MVEKVYTTGITETDSAVINQEIRGHTEKCAYNMAMKSAHDDCRDCKCHHYRKY